MICLLVVCVVREDSNGSIKTVLFDLGYFLAGVGVGTPRVKIVYLGSEAGLIGTSTGSGAA